MGTRGWMLRTFVGCCMWILHGLGAAVAVPVTTEGAFEVDTAFPSTTESQVPHALVLGTEETSTAVALLPGTTADAEIATSLADSLLIGGPTSPSFPTGAELSDLVTAASEYGPRSAAGSDAEASPSPPEPEETQVPAGDLQALANVTKSLNMSQENKRGLDAPAADTASFSTHEPPFSPNAEPSVAGAAPDTSLGTTPDSLLFVDTSNNSVSVTREGAEDLEPAADTASAPNFPSPSAGGAQPTPGATGEQAADSPLGLGMTTPPSRGLDTATAGVSEEGVTLAVDFRSGASAPSLSPNPRAGELLATRQDKQANEATSIIWEPAEETVPAAEEGPTPLEDGNAGDAIDGAFGASDLSHLPPGSGTVLGAAGNMEETSRLAGETELSPNTLLGPERDEQGSPGVDLDSPNSVPSPAASEALAASAEPDVQSTTTSLAASLLPAHTALLPVGTVAPTESSLHPALWDAATSGLPSLVDIPTGSSASLASPSTADSPQLAPDAVASTLSRADDGAEMLASPKLGRPVSPSLGSEPQGMAAGTSEGAGLPSANGPGTGLNPALDVPSLAFLGPALPIPGGWLGVGPGLPAAEGSEAGAEEQVLEGSGSTARGEPSLSSAPGSGTAVGTDQLPDTGSLSGPASPDDVVAASSVLETDGAGPIPEAVPGPDSPSQASLDSQGGPDLAAALGAESTGNVAGAGNPESPSPGTDTSPPAFSPQQDPAILGELSAGEAGALTDAELSHPLALGNGAGVATTLRETSLPGPAAPGSAGLEPGLRAAAGRGDLPGESPSAPGSPQLALGTVAGTLSGADAGAEMPAGPSLGPVPLSLGGSELQGMVGGAPEGAGLPSADGPGTSFNPALDASGSVSLRPVGLVLPVPRGWPGANLGLPAVEGGEASAAEQALGGGSSAARGEPSLSSAPGSGTAVGTDQLPEARSPSGSTSVSDGVAASSVLETDGAGPIPEAVPGPDSPSQASLDSQGGPDLAAALGAESTGNVAGAGNPESPSPGTDTSPPAFSPQQDPAILGELSAGEAGALTDAELSHPLALGNGAGVATTLGETSLPGPAAPGSAGLEPGLGAAAGKGDLSGESPSTADSPQLAPGAVARTFSGDDDRAEMPAGPNLSTPMFPSLGGSELQGTVGSTSEGAGLPGANGPDTGLNSALDAPSPASFSLVGPVLPVPRNWPGADLGLPAAEGSVAGVAEQALGAGGSRDGGEPSLSSALGSGTVAGMNQLPDAGSLSSPASANGVAAASSLLETASVSNLRGVPSAPGFSQPAPASVEPGVPPATGEADKLAEAVPGDGASPGESQGPAVEGTSGSGAPDGTVRAAEHSAPSSLSVEGSSSLGTAGMATAGAGLTGVSGGADGSNTGSAASGPGSSDPEGAPVSAPGIQSGSDLGSSDAKLSQVNVVELPGGETGVSADDEASLSASLGDGAGAAKQIASGVLAPSAFASPQQTQTLVPSALDTGVATAGIASLLGSSLLLPGHGLGALPAASGGMGESSGLAPNENPPFPSSIQSGSSLAAVGTPLAAAKVLNLPLPEDETVLPWSPNDETASGMPAPSGEEPLAAPASPNVGPAVPPAAEGLSAGSRFSSPVLTSDLTAGPSVLEKGDLRAASSIPAGPALLLPSPQPESPGVPSGSAAAEGRGDTNSPGELSPGLPSAAPGPGASAWLRPGMAMEPPAQPSLEQGPAGGGSSGLAPIRIAAGSPTTKILGPGSAGGSSSVALQSSGSSKAIAGLTNAVAAGSAAAGSSVPAAFPGQGAARGGPPATACLAVSCSPAAAGPASPALLRGGAKVLPRPGANGAAALLPQASSTVLPAPLGGPAAPLSVTAVAAVPLYRYGARENDREYVERRVDFNSPLFKPETGFPFGKALRDSLYFTDNGQIIFPASDHNIFPYPNPPPGGFNGREKIPMIAVFWDDADFSRGVGTTFYQEFFTLNSAKPSFIRDVEAKIRHYMKTSYSAAWTLKVTWEKAPAHTAQMDTRRTSTYQAVLTTDGFRSYLLILYQDGGMKWDHTQLAATNVLIGYSSGDGFYHNDDLTQRPPAAKYRPDQFRGYNTDLRGLWIYKLESRVGANYRLKCLAWTGRQQEPRVWSRGLPTCPCSLQQGQQDPRFRSARGGRLGARLTMLHSASPNQYGAGVRCLYDSQSQFVEGRQERYWRSSRQASPYRDQELKLHNWCCNQAGSAQLCARYSEKRPKIGCDGYQSPSTGQSSEEANSYSEEQEDGEAV